MIATEINKTEDNAGIRQQIEDFVSAFSARDLNSMMSLYAPEIVSFDIVAPLQDTGTETYRKVWEETFALFQGQINIEIRDLNITAAGTVAFSHLLLRLQATRTGGQTVDYWERLTLCFCKMDGKWLITHEHVSVPIDFESGRAMLHLQP
jgi:ketosteroid isomerase-like protein